MDSFLMDIQEEVVECIKESYDDTNICIYCSNEMVFSKPKFIGNFLKKKISSKGDYVLQIKRLEMMHCLCRKKKSNKKKVWVSSYDNNSKNVVYVTLDRAKITNHIIKSTLERSTLHGQTMKNLSGKLNKVQCYLNSFFDHIGNYRNLMTAYMICKIQDKYERADQICLQLVLWSEEYQNYITKELCFEELKNMFKSNYLNDVLDEKNIIVTDWNKNIDELLKDLKNTKGWTSDGNSCYIEHNLKKEKVYVSKDGEYCDHTKLVPLIKDDSNNIKTEMKKQLIIASNKQMNKIEKAILLWNYRGIDSLKPCSESSDISLCCYEEKVDIVNSDESNMTSLVRNRSKELWDSYRMKYGKQVQDESWKRIIDEVTTASLKLDLISNSLHKKISINQNESDDYINSSRNSLFILYNYARLSKIIEHFNEKVDQGRYESMPNVSKIDCELLTEENEWNLVLRYVTQFPQIINEIIDSLTVSNTKKVDIPIRQLYQFLFQMSHDTSTYYHQTKVLLEPLPHLQSLTYARVLLIMSLKKVMDDCFEILGIDAPTQM